MVIPLPFNINLPASMGPAPAPVIKLRPLLQVCAALVAAMAIWTLVFTIKFPSASRIHGGIIWVFIYSLLSTAALYAASAMELRWVSWFGMTSTMIAVIDLIIFLDMWVKGVITPFSGSVLEVFTVATCYVPIFIFAFSSYVTYQVYKLYAMPDMINNGWQQDQDARGITARSGRPPATIEPFSGVGNRLGATDL
eukprot:GEMP01087887.1.p1 GENE.GEMP01087887.1~~GEMP01087887.1.p1  ORF type:complete len:195 (+),score=25.05 GEMP01087887.1:329-913(+)